jgi:hypothetical protein
MCMIAWEYLSMINREEDRIALYKLAFSGVSKLEGNTRILSWRSIGLKSIVVYD